MSETNNTSLSFGCAELIPNVNDVTITKITTSNNEHIMVLGDATDEGQGSLMQRLAKSLVINEAHYPIIEPQSDCKASWMDRMNPYMQYSGLAVALFFAAILYAFDGFKGM